MARMGAWDRLPSDERLRRVRHSRAGNRRDAAALGAVINGEARALQRLERRLRGVGDAWLAQCPEHLLDKTAIVGVSRGALTIRARDASIRYELDRWLRAGGERAVIAASQAPIRKVRVVA